MKMKNNLLWILTIVNSIVLIIIILVFIASLTYPAQSDAKFLEEEIKKEREWVQKQLDLNVEHVEKELKKQNEYNEANTKRIFDYVNSR